MWIQNLCSCSSARPARSPGGGDPAGARPPQGRGRSRRRGHVPTLAGGVSAPDHGDAPLAPELGAAAVAVDLAAHVEGVVLLVVHAGEGEDVSLHPVLLGREKGEAVRASAVGTGRGSVPSSPVPLTIQLVSLLLLYLTACSRHCALGYGELQVSCSWLLLMLRMVRLTGAPGFTAQHRQSPVSAVPAPWWPWGARGPPAPLRTEVLQLHALAADLQGLAVDAGVEEDVERLELDDLALVEVAADADPLVPQVVLALQHGQPGLVPVRRGLRGLSGTPTLPGALSRCVPPQRAHRRSLQPRARHRGASGGWKPCGELAWGGGTYQ